LCLSDNQLGGLKTEAGQKEAAVAIQSLAGKDLFVWIICPEEARAAVDNFIAQFSTIGQRRTTAWVVPGGKTIEVPKSNNS
jgi:hypothetical protein